jgi:hypothetical protein
VKRVAGRRREVFLAEIVAYACFWTGSDCWCGDTFLLLAPDGQSMVVGGDFVAANVDQLEAP